MRAPVNRPRRRATLTEHARNLAGLGMTFSVMVSIATLLFIAAKHVAPYL